MKNILCFGDSNTYGFNPNNTGAESMRFAREERWTGRLQRSLGAGYYVIEEGLSGRSTAFDDPITPGRRGASALLPCIHSHQPLDLILIMLGTNDVKTVFSATAEDIGRGMRGLVETALNPFVTYARKPPEILIIAPPPIGEGIKKSPTMGGSFDLASREKSLALAREYHLIAEAYGCHFLDAGTVTGFCPEECVHLDRTGHEKLAAALVARIEEIFVNMTELT